LRRRSKDRGSQDSTIYLSIVQMLPIVGSIWSLNGSPVENHYT
jgi:hypothetical protein